MDKDIRILNREETVREIEKLIYYAKKELIIISPYVSITEEYKDEIINCRSKFKVIIVRENENFKDYNFFKNENFIIKKAKNLHSKIYLNENWLIFSSMNLYKYSIENNFESSIMLRRNKIKDEEIKPILEILYNAKKY
ncbi:MAG: hypothetical protein CMP76_12250 [Flavobacterium sp.]|uniref:hypothetical protein n=1 Tax=Flavobacterium sp. TaxID=239 RepID=UPI000C421FB7|nr:hypothetical protein [Flavobacterium sp.]MBF04057.1 hypothetical protein [Flavobacterium sp.]|tara:strand:- start:450 stop:866 length:417 start_codon:yes stop_codon:yes gene_type:complete